ncbi:3-oxoacyl-ACP synthase III family protein [Streptomyces sp. NPDC059698]|uniref:3-oxoacyl-ACP synthase III family protein n=1 Tax=unclassified Streptomyces TaxID=2593676 RepID=UPI000939E942|nr:ketoacyl-ACP synthase III [Streptomyces sp. CB02366]OKJ41064.1 3-oxoacyl-ACP synthase [Streptomyces sp. CB02366]TVP33538.1 3-oxoacyl-ACP synthase [Streptomyces griseus subsp. griseus]
MAIGVISVGAHLPERIVDNREIAAWADVTEEWVAERTGILQRRYAAAGEATSDLALPAAREALDEAGPEAGERLAALIVATCTPDHPQPSTAAIVQAGLGLPALPAFDVNAVCSGFLYALTVAKGLLDGQPGQYALVVGADLFSTLMDRGDRKTVSLFGDGAGAVVLGPVPEGYGIHGSTLLADGELHDYVKVEAGGTRTPLDERARAAGEHLFRMDGRAVREYAMTTLHKVVGQTLAECGARIEDVDRFVFHQANTRLLESFAAEAGIDPAKVALTAPTLGNTAAASVPLTLHHTHHDRPLERGERVLLASIGGGMTAAAALMTWY